MRDGAMQSARNLLDSSQTRANRNLPPAPEHAVSLSHAMRPKRQKVVLAVLGSVLLHGIALGLFALIVALKPPAPPEPPPDEPMKLEMVQEEPPETPPPIPEVVATPTPPRP